jgi:ubiquinone/menaquinone biosynthesis C-methylase UbiE
MEDRQCKRSATVSFGDGYTKWYKLWSEHNRYHDRIIETLTEMVEPGWRVLDVGGGSGILSFPLCALGCDVTIIEPSVGMRGLLYENALRQGIERVTVDERTWEDIPCRQLTDYDMIMACNSLHLTTIGFAKSAEKIFQVGPRNVFLVTELSLPTIKARWPHGAYRMTFNKCYAQESSFFYHTLEEVYEHWLYKEGGVLLHHEGTHTQAQLEIEEEHLRIRDTAHAGMYWWERKEYDA